MAHFKLKYPTEWQRKDIVLAWLIPLFLPTESVKDMSQHKARSATSPFHPCSSCEWDLPLKVEFCQGGIQPKPLENAVMQSIPQIMTGFPLGLLKLEGCVYASRSHRTMVQVQAAPTSHCLSVDTLPSRALACAGDRTDQNQSSHALEMRAELHGLEISHASYSKG